MDESELIFMKTYAEIPGKAVIMTTYLDEKNILEINLISPNYKTMDAVLRVQEAVACFDGMWTLGEVLESVNMRAGLYDQVIFIRSSCLTLGEYMDVDDALKYIKDYYEEPDVPTVAKPSK